MDCTGMVYSRTASSDLLSIFSYMTSNLMYLSFSTLRSSFLWRIDNVIFTKLDKPPRFSQITPGELYRGFTVMQIVLMLILWVFCRFFGLFHPRKRIFICTSSGCYLENNKTFFLATKLRNVVALTWKQEIPS